MSSWARLIDSIDLSLTSSRDWLLLRRKVRFGDTDAAGVMHFYHLLQWCHEAWEESIELYGLQIDDIFPNGRKQDVSLEVILPIIHCDADFLGPIFAGDNLLIELIPTKLNPTSFQSVFKFRYKDDYVATGLIRHIAIQKNTRKPVSLPRGIDLWLKDSKNILKHQEL